MSETVYIETSILGYLTARSTKDLILAANIEITKDWWESRRNDFTLYTSEAVLNEVAQGDCYSKTGDPARSFLVDIKSICTRFSCTVPDSKQSASKSES